MPPVPEMIEVECYRRVAAAALGRRIRAVKVVDDRYCRGATTARTLRAALVGRRFTEARRHGKLLVLETTGPPLGLRFGMTGGLVVDGAAALDRLRYGPGRFDRAWVRFSVRFDGGGELLLHDPRRLGSVELAPDESAMGPDAGTVTAAQLRAALTTRGPGPGPAVKARLQDQARLAGVGNLLSDEILWRAALAPQRPSGSLTTPELRRLHRHLLATVAELTERGGSHTGDLMPERRPGGHCPRDAAALRRDTVGGRTAWWCPAHQH